MTDPVSESEFERLADIELNRLFDALIASGAPVDPDLESGVLSITFDDDSKYVVNSHRAARQIWMAAERSAWHFDYDPAEKRWVTSRADAELWSAVTKVLTNKVGREVALR